MIDLCFNETTQEFNDGIQTPFTASQKEKPQTFKGQKHPSGTSV